MKLVQKYIRTLKKLLSDVDHDEYFCLGIELTHDINNQIEDKFISLDEGDEIFPAPIYGIMSRRNAIGEYIPQKTQPKEIAYRANSWRLTDWNGHVHSGVTYIPYKRYPRKFIEPKEFKIVLKEIPTGEKILLISKKFQKGKDNDEVIYAANLCLELFGSVETFKYNEQSIILNKIESVNWEILPIGDTIWPKLNEFINSKKSNSEAELSVQRLQYFQEQNPSRILQGIGGYLGYLIFVYDDIGISILEAIGYGNATYIFDDNWEELSKLTKKEIISGKLALDRIIHNNSWNKKVFSYFE